MPAPRRFAYWICSGVTITQFLSAVTGRPALACAAECCLIMPLICFMYLALRLTHRCTPFSAVPLNSM